MIFQDLAPIHSRVQEDRLVISPFAINANQSNSANVNSNIDSSSVPLAQSDVYLSGSSYQNSRGLTHT